jgi:DNA-binding response OmpR family regulator
MTSPSLPLTVLIADPDISQQEALAASLQPRYRVVHARTLAETIDMLARVRPDVLLLEINQPDGDGVELIRRLREERQTRDLIIACVTNRATIRDKVTGFQAGADDYIVKPVNPQTFVWRIVLLARLRQMSS